MVSLDASSTVCHRYADDGHPERHWRRGSKQSFLSGRRRRGPTSRNWSHRFLALALPPAKLGFRWGNLLPWTVNSRNLGHIQLRRILPFADRHQAAGHSGLHRRLLWNSTYTARLVAGSLNQKDDRTNKSTLFRIRAERVFGKWDLSRSTKQ